MKRSMDSDGNTDMAKRYRSQDIAIRLLISSRAAGSVIGRGGSNISRLRTENSATVTIPDTLGPERLVNIGADRDTTLKIVADLLSNLDDTPGRDSESTEGEVRFLVHTSQAGSIIGKSGFKIKELREETGTQIRVYTEPCPQSSDRVVQISGQHESIIQCLGRILALLDESPPKGMSSPYDPSNYDEMYAADYGGFADGRGRPPPAAAWGVVATARGGGGGGMAGGPRSFGPQGMGGMGGMRGGMGGARGGMSPRGGFWPRDGGRGGMSGMGGMQGQMGQLPPGGMDFSAPAGGDVMTLMQSNGSQAGGETQQFSVPKNSVGAIIGKGGARIRKIRQDSGAQINIDDAKDGQTERVVTITGTAEQLQMAHFLLQKSVRENGEGMGGY